MRWNVAVGVVQLVCKYPRALRVKRLLVLKTALLYFLIQLLPRKIYFQQTFLMYLCVI